MAFEATPACGRRGWWTSDLPQRSQLGSINQAPSQGRKSSATTAAPRWQPLSSRHAATSGPGGGRPSQL
eukprot:1443536-Alexandrium_andersonii.AAC.1